MIRATLLAMTLATPAMAEVMTVQTTKYVPAAMDALEAAVREAGARSMPGSTMLPRPTAWRWNFSRPNC